MASTQLVQPGGASPFSRRLVDTAIRILSVGDEQLARRISTGLVGCGFHVIDAARTAQARGGLAVRDVDAIICARMPSDRDAIEEVGKWRRAGLRGPVLVLSSRGGLHHRLAGLDAGADDYLVGPFHPAELEAKLRALLRAQDRYAQSASDIIVCGSIRIDRRTRKAERAGVPLLLQPREYRLLEALTAAAGEVVPRSVLLKTVWNLNFDPGTKVIETHVSRLRDKLDMAGSGEVIETVRGIGYRVRNDA
jgi:two-component system OmpR family response regulator